jgi:hypothetical protein
VSRFLAGFLVASLLWGGLIGAHAAGLVDLGLSPAEQAPPDAGVAIAADDEPEAPGKKRRPRAGKRAARRDARYAGESTSGDDLGGPDSRELSAATAGGEEQLLGSEIEAGFDSVFPQVRRCLMLAAGDEVVTGKVVFGLRISGKGGVERVNLQGPSAVTQGEAGECLRRAARGIRFRSFDGPDMLVHFPLTLQ